jgi:hypothetical protein
MAKKVILGGVLGGLVMFLWGAFSWMVLPWHDLTIGTFSQESLVAGAVLAQAPRDGVYLLPNARQQNPRLSLEEKAQALSAAKDRMKVGPFIFMSVARGGIDPGDPMLFVRSLIIQIVGATLITMLLVQTRGLRFWCRVGFVETAGITIAIFATLPLWNWWQFPLPYTLVNFADLVIAAIFAGLVIAWVVGDITEEGP